jgi:uncharacterized protein YdhG (YjbR/CyaY superfamily)
MAEKQAVKKSTRRSAKSAGGDATEGFSAEEKAAMRERVKEMKSRSGKGDGESDVLAKIAEMEGQDRVMAERFHAIVKASAPELSPRTWYGMPAYSKDGKVLCFFRDARKFKERYATFGFQETANLDDGPMWPTSYALKEMTPDVEARIAALVKQAAS